MLSSYVKVNVLIMDLRSDALRDRHWKVLQKRLRVNWPGINDLTLGMVPCAVCLATWIDFLPKVWDADLQKNETAVKDVVLQSQGEMALEEFLRQVKETWSTYQLDLVNYQNKCRLIRGWDDLFNKCAGALLAHV